jgi:hypothetical protein
MKYQDCIFAELKEVKHKYSLLHLKFTDKDLAEAFCEVNGNALVKDKSDYDGTVLVHLLFRSETEALIFIKWLRCPVGYRINNVELDTNYIYDRIKVEPQPKINVLAGGFR